MKTENRLALAGLLLLAAVFVAAAWRVFSREAPALRAGRAARLTFAHYLVYESNRQFFNAVIRDFEAIHPGVRVEQIDVPPMVWQAWRQTRFTGGTPPDIIQLGRGLDDEQHALHLLPLTDALAKPNPYNRGNDLEHVPWKDTFVDGLLESESSFRQNLQEFYGVTSYLNLLRVYYNRELLAEVSGEDRPPRTFREFIALCETTSAWAKRHDQRVVPLAGSVEYSRNLFDRVLHHQTQRLAAQVDLERDRRMPDNREQAIAWLRGEWKLDDPALLASWTMLREISRHYQGGFLSATRDEAGFLFKQGKALMIVTGSWDANYLMTDTKFPTGAFAIPLPTIADGPLGVHPLGGLNELAESPTGGFGISRRSAHPDLAIEFLQFLSSRAVNQRFADDCLRLPVIAGTTVPHTIAAFAPEVTGYQRGFTLSFLDWSAKNSQRLFNASLDRLVNRNGGIEEFLATFGEGFRSSLRQDLVSAARGRRRTLQRGDALELALWHLSPGSDTPAPENDARHLRRARLGLNQTLADAAAYQDRLVLSGALDHPDGPTR